MAVLLLCLSGQTYAKAVKLFIDTIRIKTNEFIVVESTTKDKNQDRKRSFEKVAKDFERNKIF